MIKTKIPTFFGILVLTVGIAMGVLLVQSRQIFKLGASPASAPKNVRVTNIDSSSFTVSWITDKETVGFVTWGKTKDSINTITSQDFNDSTNTHLVNINGLDAISTYYFKINSDGTKYDNNGLPWEVTTGPNIGTSPNDTKLSGSVIDPLGKPSPNTLIYVSPAGSNTLSTITSKNGNWFIQLSPARTPDFSSFANIDENSTLVEISALAGDGNISTAQIYPVSANPVPPMILGQAHDYRSANLETTTDSPKANLNLPTSTDSPKFEVKGTSTQVVQDVTVDSIKDGEVVFTTKPEIFGDGPVGTALTITVHSDPITDSVTVNSSGSWAWSPPVNLEEGEHNLTVSWVDKNGILRKITQSFIVQAAEGPSFESTPPATTKPTATPTPIPTLTPTPTSVPQPISGVGTPTVIMAMLGISSLFLSAYFFFWEKDVRNY